MKKALSIFLCLTMILSFAACGNKNSNLELGESKEYEVETYKFNLPASYEYNDLAEVKAETNCIAMLTDSEGKLPDLWVYEDECQGASLEEHLNILNDQWSYSSISCTSKGNNEVAKTVYDEDWYGEELVNEHYYRLEQDNKVISFDFAYPKADDSELVHEYIAAIAEVLGF